ncbi:MAG: hypothetical protein KIS29_08710 [Thermoplasmata archaeon]|nr:hypothetical protein [Candidatus Sysuiplasma jiujiangense]
MNNGNTYVTHNKVRDVLDELAEHNKSVFTLNDAARIMNKPKKYVSKLLAMSRKVTRIERGKYFITTGKNIDFYEIASQIVFPSYISLFAAFEYYDVTDQVITTVSVVSLKRHRPVALYGHMIEFRSIQKKRFFGYKKTENTYIATIEKAIIDALYFNAPPMSYVQETFSEAVKRDIIDVDKLLEFSRRMNSSSLVRKVELLLGPRNRSLAEEGSRRR